MREPALAANRALLTGSACASAADGPHRCCSSSSYILPACRISGRWRHPPLPEGLPQAAPHLGRVAARALVTNSQLVLKPPNRWGTTVRVWDLDSRKVVAKWDLAKLPKIRVPPQGLMSVRWTGGRLLGVAPACTANLALRSSGAAAMLSALCSSRTREVSRLLP